MCLFYDRIIPILTHYYNDTTLHFILYICCALYASKIQQTTLMHPCRHLPLSRTLIRFLRRFRWLFALLKERVRSDLKCLRNRLPDRRPATNFFWGGGVGAGGGERRADSNPLAKCSTGKKARARIGMWAHALLRGRVHSALWGGQLRKL